MRLFFDLDLNALVASATVRAPLSSVAFTYRSSPQLEVRFVRAGVVVDLGAPDLFFVVKAAGQFEASALLASATSWTKSGTGTSAFWYATAAFSSAALASALGYDGNPANDLASVTATGFLGFTLSGQRQEASFSAVVRNSGYAGTESQPLLDASGRPLLVLATPAGALFTLQNATDAVESWARAANVLTLTLTSHGLAAGQAIQITGETAINGVYVIISAPTADTITVAQTATDATNGSSTGALRLLTGTLYGANTLGLPLGSTVAIDNGSAALIAYALGAGTDADSPPAILRPYDYAASTNERVWRKRTFSNS
jgi:hypothetical protein